EAEIITDEKEKEKLSSHLICNGGTGKYEGKSIYRLIKQDFLIPGGLGLVANPASQVKGIEIINPSNDNNSNSSLSSNFISQLEELKESGPGYQIIDIELKDGSVIKEQKVFNCSELENKDIDTKNIKSVSLSDLGPQTVWTRRSHPINNIKSLSDLRENKQIISQSIKDNVSKNKPIKKSNMKIKKIEDITDENLKEISASNITNFIDEEIDKANKEWLKKVDEEKNSTKNAQDKFESLSQEAQKTKESLEKVQKDLEKLQSEAAEKAKIDLFSQRMAHLDDIYELSDEDRSVIKDQVKDLDEKGFSSLEASFKILMKEKSKEFKKAQSKAREEAEAKVKEDKEKLEKENKDKNKESKANVENKVDDALDNSDKEKIKLPNASDNTNVSFADKYKEAFSVENCIDMQSKKK
ncbi:MAG: hypothetical protein AABY22_19770, partial [Nanoarchaeota archaeon]